MHELFFIIVIVLIGANWAWASCACFWCFRLEHTLGYCHSMGTALGWDCSWLWSFEHEIGSSLLNSSMQWWSTLSPNTVPCRVFNSEITFFPTLLRYRRATWRRPRSVPRLSGCKLPAWSEILLGPYVPCCFAWGHWIKLVLSRVKNVQGCSFRNWGCFGATHRATQTHLSIRGCQARLQVY